MTTVRAPSRSPLWGLSLTLLALTLFTLISPAEKVLGKNVRIVYLHGAWVWTALACFAAAALVGAAGLLGRRRDLQQWSVTLGRTALLFWITYLPLSMWAMQTNWNGLYLAEPRFRLALIFSVSGLLLQTGLTLLEKPAWSAAANLGYALALFLALRLTPNVMHPPSPILSSNALRIQVSFFVLFALTTLAAWQVARWWHRWAPSAQPTQGD